MPNKTCSKSKEEKSKYDREYYAKNKNYIRSRNKKWVEENRDVVNKISRNHSRKHPERKKARSAISHAIRDGKLKKLPCKTCGTIANVEAHHHNGYEHKDWLNVTWLCKTHHVQEHCNA